LEPCYYYYCSIEARAVPAFGPLALPSQPSLPHEARQDILELVADALLQGEESLAANALDLAMAEKKGIALVLKNHLELTEAKFATLASGLHQLASLPDPLKSQRKLAHGIHWYLDGDL
jgi:gamma-glutamyl phosphate reductase